MGICGLKGQQIFVSDSIIQKTNGLQDNTPMKKKKKRDLPNLSSAEKLQVGYHQIPNTFNANSSVKKKKINNENVQNHNYNSIDEEERIRSSSGLVGIKNLGNTCFINSGISTKFALQCLLNVQPLMEYFLSDLHEQEMNERNPLSSQGKITSAFADLVNKVWCDTDKYITPSDFLSVVKYFSSIFGDGSQQDSQEFLIFLLDYLHEDLNRVKEKPNIRDRDYESKDSKKWEENSQEAWRDYLKRNRSIVVDLFQGQLKSTLKCLDCGAVSHKFETFMYLSVPISEEMQQASHSLITIDDCIEEFTREETLDQTEWWLCTQCKKRTPSTKKIDLWKTPNILIVHFKRFAYTKKNRGKINSFIDFKLTQFDLSSQVTGREKVTPIYDLFAVCNHSGSLRGGHYTAYAKNRVQDEWYYFDDTSVTRVANPMKSILSSQAYVLCYSKTSPEIFQRQTLTFPEFWPHVLNISIDHSHSSHSNNNNHNNKNTHPLIPFLDSVQMPQKMTFNTLSIQKEESSFLHLNRIHSTNGFKEKIHHDEPKLSHQNISFDINPFDRIAVNLPFEYQEQQQQAEPENLRDKSLENQTNGEEDTYIIDHPSYEQQQQQQQEQEQEQKPTQMQQVQVKEIKQHQLKSRLLKRRQTESSEDQQVSVFNIGNQENSQIRASSTSSKGSGSGRGSSRSILNVTTINKIHQKDSFDQGNYSKEHPIQKRNSQSSKGSNSDSSYFQQGQNLDNAFKNVNSNLPRIQINLKPSPASLTAGAAAAASVQSTNKQIPEVWKSYSNQRGSVDLDNRIIRGDEASLINSGRSIQSTSSRNSHNSSSNNNNRLHMQQFRAKSQLNSSQSGTQRILNIYNNNEYQEHLQQSFEEENDYELQLRTHSRFSSSLNQRKHETPTESFQKPPQIPKKTLAPLEKPLMVKDSYKALEHMEVKIPDFKQQSRDKEFSSGNLMTPSILEQNLQQLRQFKQKLQQNSKGVSNSNRMMVQNPKERKRSVPLPPEDEF